MPRKKKENDIGQGANGGFVGKTDAKSKASSKTSENRGTRTRKKGEEEDGSASVSRSILRSERADVRAEIVKGVEANGDRENRQAKSSKENMQRCVKVAHGLSSSGDEQVLSASDRKESGHTTRPVGKKSANGNVQAGPAFDIGSLVHPDIFARGILGIKLYDWQAEVLRRCEVPWCKEALCAANESGKTSTVIVPLCLWHAIVFPGSRTVVTAKNERQIIHSFMDALKMYGPLLSKFNPEWKEDGLSLNFPNNVKSKIIGFTTNEGARFESFHNLPNSPLLIIVDECKKIEDEIFEAVDRCNPLRRLYASSPSNNPTGRFHSIVTENPEQYGLKFVSAFDCPHISKKRIEDAAKAYGTDSAIYRSMILGLPTEESDECIFSASAVDGCMGSLAPKWIRGAEVVFIDWSTGGDEIVVAHRNGNQVTIPLAFTTDRNGVGAQNEILDRVENELKRLGMNSGANKYIYADDDGIGWGFNNQLNERGWNVQLFRGGAKAGKPAFFLNRITECWYGAADIVKRLRVRLPYDKKLRFQLVSRKRRDESSDNPTLIRMQPKSKLRESPDRGDAVIGCMTCGPDIPFIEPKVDKIKYINEEIDDFLLDNDEELYIRDSIPGRCTGIY